MPTDRKKYMKLYGQLPKRKEYIKKYNQRPEVKSRHKEYEKTEKVKETRKEYSQRPEVKIKRKEQAREKRKNPILKKKEIESHRKYNTTDKGKKKNKEYRIKNYSKLLEIHKKYIKKPEVKLKMKARKKSERVKIPKNEKCCFCNENLATQKHHPDYSKPLEIMFCCKPCHDKLRRIKL